MSAPDLTASDRNIDVWLAFYEEIDDPQLHGRYRELLTEEERGKEFRFYFPHDQRCYLVTRALVRTVLSRYVAVAPQDWRFSANAYGRPEIAVTAPEAGQLRFNISHTRGLIALGVTRHQEVGLDVENVSTRQVSLDIADRFFAPVEVAELAGVRPERRQERFFEYWTFKESYIKARGMGLSIPLQQFSFHYPHERAVRLVTEPSLQDDPGRWSFWQYRPTERHLLALCAGRDDYEPPTVTIRKVVPLRSELPVQPELLKTSEFGTR